MLFVSMYTCTEQMHLVDLNIINMYYEIYSTLYCVILFNHKCMNLYADTENEQEDYYDPYKILKPTLVILFLLCLVV